MFALYQDRPAPLWMTAGSHIGQQGNLIGGRDEHATKSGGANALAQIWHKKVGCCPDRRAIMSEALRALEHPRDPRWPYADRSQHREGRLFPARTSRSPRIRGTIALVYEILVAPGSMRSPIPKARIRVLQSTLSISESRKNAAI